MQDREGRYSRQTEETISGEDGMNQKEYDEIQAKLANLAEAAREVSRAASLLSGEIDGMRRAISNMKGRQKA